MNNNESDQSWQSDATVYTDWPNRAIQKCVYSFIFTLFHFGVAEMLKEPNKMEKKKKKDEPQR